MRLVALSGVLLLGLGLLLLSCADEPGVARDRNPKSDGSVGGTGGLIGDSGGFPDGAASGGLAGQGGSGGAAGSAGGSGDAGLTRVQSGLVALYRFKEGKGVVVKDTSKVAPALDLTISDSTKASWVGGGLKITHTPGSSSHIASQTTADKITAACKKSKRGNS